MRGASLGLLILGGCSGQENDRLDLLVRSPAGLPRPVSLLVYVRDDGPPRAVGAAVYLPPPAEQSADVQKITLKPDTPFLGDVTTYIIGCGGKAICPQSSGGLPECRCENPVSFGGGLAQVSGHTKLEIVLNNWRSACDPDHDGVVGCRADATCCVGLPTESRARIEDCADVPASSDCTGTRCDPRRAHPFMPSEPTAEAATSDPTLVERNAAFCDDGLDNDCAGPKDTACAQVDQDRDGYSPGGDPADCDDGNLNVHPNQEDNCSNALDDNCDGVVDVCDRDRDGTVDSLDCGPDDPARFLGAPDTCGDGIDQDCDGGDSLCIPDDLDGDNFPCVVAELGGTHRCAGPGQDCDDLDAAIHPGAADPCEPPGVEPVDDNCDGVATPCPDSDQDGDGARSRTAGGADCDDRDARRFPGAPERCGDGVDQDCDGADLPCGTTQDQDGDGWPAGADCNDREANTFPGAAEYCNGRDDDCDGVADEGNPLQLGPAGPVESERCGDECPGDVPCRCYTAPQVCSPDPAAADRKLILCIGVSAGRYVEVCNGQDDDCDGRLNNVTGDETLLSQPCYTGPLATENIGVCHGSLSYCVAQVGADAADPAIWGPCDGEVLPHDEVCNALDENCDGTLNEAADGQPMQDTCYPCEGGTPGFGACVRGVTRCLENTWTPCDGFACPSPDGEVCNGRDDDCDGDVDVLDDSPLTTGCYTGPRPTRDVGDCRDGTATCVNGDFVGCAGEQLPAAEDSCDAHDEDCDGQVDEELARRCGMTDLGVCEFGTQRCAQGDWGRCEGDVDPGSEICNNLDDDCDGHIDNGVTRPCGSDTGACQRGTEACAAGAWDGRCRNNVEPSLEVCNSLDDNCDGAVDEGLGVGDVCAVGVGACRRSGHQVCAVGGGVACDVMPGSPRMETCNGVDDNCDGSSDEGFNLGNACTTGQGVCRRDGRLACDGAGGVTCEAPGGEPQMERCNALDDDCNGQVDDGLNLGQACARGVGPCRVAGVRICDGMGGVTCDAVALPGAAETCNGVDDNCNETVDDGGPSLCGPNADRCAGADGCRCGDNPACAMGVACAMSRCGN